MRKLLLISIVLAGFALSSCYQVSVGTKRAGVPSRNPDYESWQTLLIYGLVPISTHHKINDICANGVEAVKTYMSFLNGLVGFLTMEIYTPVTLQVWCKGGKTVQLQMDPNTPQMLKKNLSEKDYNLLMSDINKLLLKKAAAYR